ncbi:hypothetical protein SXCC_04486 [Gluconacetobacter sp. SXCC-1]|nr:hypothetical protein SXCC_04486 [Gluconacetobacter sp. SXCC-1]
MMEVAPHASAMPQAGHGPHAFFNRAFPEWPLQAAAQFNATDR